jgi:hypothetical protein
MGLVIPKLQGLVTDPSPFFRFVHMLRYFPHSLSASFFSTTSFSFFHAFLGNVPTYFGAPQQSRGKEGRKEDREEGRRGRKEGKEQERKQGRTEAKKGRHGRKAWEEGAEGSHGRKTQKTISKPHTPLNSTSSLFSCQLTSHLSDPHLCREKEGRKEGKKEGDKKERRQEGRQGRQGELEGKKKEERTQGRKEGR